MLRPSIELTLTRELLNQGSTFLNLVYCSQYLHLPIAPPAAVCFPYRCPIQVVGRPRKLTVATTHLIAFNRGTCVLNFFSPFIVSLR